MPDRYPIRNGEHGIQNALDREWQKRQDERAFRARFAEEGRAVDPTPAPQSPYMSPEEWQERIPLLNAFLRQGYLWQWMGDRRGWCKVTHTDFSAHLSEYSETWRDEAPDMP